MLNHWFGVYKIITVSIIQFVLEDHENKATRAMKLGTPVFFLLVRHMLSTCKNQIPVLMMISTRANSGQSQTFGSY